MVNRAADPVLFGFLRHGEVAGPAHVYRGRSDAPLTPHGLLRMHDALAALPDWGAVVSSPARRCLDFAHAIAADRRIDCAIDPDWHELDFGAWENLCPDKAALRDADAHAAFVRDPRCHPPPGGETLDALDARPLLALDMRLGEASGAATAIPLLRLACALHAGMATFAEAGVAHG